MQHRIIYSNGVTQVKNLISHSLYIDFKEATDKLVAEKGSEKLIKQLSSDFKSTHGEEWFTDKSPLGLAIGSGLLVLPDHQGGTSKCTIVPVLK